MKRKLISRATALLAATLSVVITALLVVPSLAGGHRQARLRSDFRDAQPAKSARGGFSERELADPVRCVSLAGLRSIEAGNARREPPPAVQRTRPSTLLGLHDAYEHIRIV